MFYGEDNDTRFSPGSQLSAFSDTRPKSVNLKRLYFEKKAATGIPLPLSSLPKGPDERLKSLVPSPRSAFSPTDHLVLSPRSGFTPVSALRSRNLERESHTSEEDTEEEEL
jgi:hypothetical protein